MMELLAPAGDLKILKSAYAAGADAVYLGGDAFGARVAAAFSREDGAAAIEYAHSRGKRVYLTVNTLLKNVEMERELYDFLEFYNGLFVDGIIVQDFGVFAFCRKFFPSLPLHASTQMNITSEYGARFMMEQGASRIVPARELSVSEISAIHDALPDLEIETFLHGALCVCYSGQCLMSSIIGGRSGNRGACAQPCRKKYSVYADGKRLSDEGYYLSPKDLCGIHALPRLYEAGVCSYKIEGRLKNEAYVAGVVSVYRKYFDMLSESGASGYEVDERDEKRLLSYGSRGGGTDSYFDMRNDLSMIDPSVGAFHQDDSEVELPEKKRMVSAVLSVEVGEPISMNVTYGTLTISVEGGMAELAKSKATTREEIIDKLSKTGEEPFDFSEIVVDIEGEPFVPMKHIKVLRHRAFEILNGMLLKKYAHREVRPYEKVKLPTEDVSLEQPELFVSVSTAEQLFAVRGFDYIAGIIVQEELLGQCDFSVYFRLPDVIRCGDVERITGLIKKHRGGIAGVYANSYDALGLLRDMGYPDDRIYFGERLYSYSDRTVAAFMDIGYNNLYMPQELNEKELSHRYNKSSIMDIYGQMPVMIMTNCPAKRFLGCNRMEKAGQVTGQVKQPYKRIALVDERGAAFPVVNHCKSCTNYVYNSLPMSLLSDAKSVLSLHPQRLLMSFVFEEADEVRELLDIYEKNYLMGMDKKPDIDTTRGHFRRGVK